MPTGLSKTGAARFAPPTEEEKKASIDETLSRILGKSAITKKRKNKSTVRLDDIDIIPKTQSQASSVSSHHQIVSLGSEYEIIRRGREKQETIDDDIISSLQKAKEMPKPVGDIFLKAVEDLLRNIPEEQKKRHIPPRLLKNIDYIRGLFSLNNIQLGTLDHHINERLDVFEHSIQPDKKRLYNDFKGDLTNEKRMAFLVRDTIMHLQASMRLPISEATQKIGDALRNVDLFKINMTEEEGRKLLEQTAYKLPTATLMKWYDEDNLSSKNTLNASLVLISILEHSDELSVEQKEKYENLFREKFENIIYGITLEANAEFFAKALSLGKRLGSPVEQELNDVYKEIGEYSGISLIHVLAERGGDKLNKVFEVFADDKEKLKGIFIGKYSMETPDIGLLLYMQYYEYDNDLSEEDKSAKRGENLKNFNKILDLFDGNEPNLRRLLRQRESERDQATILHSLADRKCEEYDLKKLDTILGKFDFTQEKDREAFLDLMSIGDKESVGSPLHVAAEENFREYMLKLLRSFKAQSFLMLEDNEEKTFIQSIKDPNLKSEIRNFIKMRDIKAE